jgi:hypothetical protein
MAMPSYAERHTYRLKVTMDLALLNPLVFLILSIKYHVNFIYSKIVLHVLFLFFRLTRNFCFELFCDKQEKGKLKILSLEIFI